jgi:hypothetical protein
MIENITMIIEQEKSRFRRLGDYIKLVDNRNKDLAVTNLLGINITKNFMPSVANVSGTDLSKYKVIQKGQFAYSAMQVGRDETVRVVLYTFGEPAIISPAYHVFRVKDEKEVLQEFLMLWFYRPEFNRFGWFISDSSVRAIRLKGCDYSQAGLYFITICCQDRICRFGHVDNGEMILNKYGQIAYNEWMKLSERVTII